MARALKTAALVVGAIALAAATYGFGAALLAPGATLAGAAAAAGAQATIIGGLSAKTLFAISAGLSVASGLTQKRPQPSGGGSQTEFQADPRAGMPYAMGRTGTNGRLVLRRAADGWSANTPNDLNDLVTVLSGAGPIDGIESFTSDGKVITFDAGGNAVGEFRDKMFQRTQLGQCPEPIALTVTAGASVAPTGWTADHKLSGMAAAMWRLRYDSKQRFFQNGVPKPMWVGRWVKVYDPRLDSTYPGGNGPQRWYDESTWEWSENPYLHGLTWVIGRHQNGKRVMGLGASIDQIIVSDFVEGANIAGANGWTISGVVYSRPDTKWNNLKLMLQAGAGVPLRVGARIGCLVNTPRVSLATVTEADLAGEVELSMMAPPRARINGAIPRYLSEAHNWEVVPGAEISVPAYVAADGDERTRELEYRLVPSAMQAGQLARYEIEDSREAGPGTLPLKPVWIGYTGGDCVTLQLPNADPIKLLLLTRQINPSTTVVTFDVRTETDAKHAAALGTAATPPPVVEAPDEASLPTPDGEWTLDETVEGFAPALLFTGAVGAGAVDEVLFEIRKDVDDSPWMSAGLEPASVTRKAVVSGLEPGATYLGRVTYRTRGVLSEPAELGPVTVTSEIVIDGNFF